MKIDWKRAACNGVDTDLFFDEATVEDARAWCATCPIKVDCEAYAYERKEKFGVWGGTSETDRTRLTRPQTRVKCPGCGGTDHLDDGSHTVCFSCGITWRNLE